LKQLQTLKLFTSERSITIPALPSLGKVEVDAGELKNLFIAGSVEDYPIYHFKLNLYRATRKLVVSRPISLMEFGNIPEPQMEIVGRENIKELLIIK
jgi:hypothetical protein